MQNRRNFLKQASLMLAGWVGSPSSYYLLVAVNQDKLPLQHRSLLNI